MKIIAIFLLLVSYTLFAKVSDDKKILNVKELKERELEIEAENKRVFRISEYVKVLEQIEKEVLKEKVWTKSYASYLTSLAVRDSLQKIKKRIKYLSKKRKKTISQQD